MKLHKKARHRIAATLLGVSAGLALASAASAADFTMKVSGGGQNEPQAKYIADFGQCLEAASGDRIDVQAYPGTQLGGLATQIQGLQLGTIEAAIMAGQHMKSIDKRYGVIDAAGLFNGFEQTNATFWDPDFEDKFLQLGRDKGVFGLALWAYGPTSFQTVEPVKSLADFKGLKLRILATEIEQRLTDSIGATGLQVDYGDLIPALQRGQIDGVHSSIVLAHAFKFYTVAKHTTLTNEAMIPIILAVSTKFFDKLPEDLQTATLDCARNGAREIAPYAEEFGKDAETRWQEAGGEIHALSDAEQKELRERVAQIVDDVYGNDPDLKDIYGLLKATAAKHQ